MGELVEFSQKEKRNLYIVDDFYVILATSPKEALNFVQNLEQEYNDMDVEPIDENHEIHFIESGKVEVALWKRLPNFSEKLTFKLTSRKFIDEYLKRFSTPSKIDVLEDRGNANPKR